MATNSAAAQLRHMILGFRTTKVLAVAARLELADRIATGGQTVNAIATSLDVDPDSLGRLLRALGSLGLVVEGDDGALSLTELGQGMRRDAPGSARAMALLYGEPWLWAAYAHLDEAVRTGRPAFEQAHDAPLFAYLERHPEAEAIFQGAMSAFSAQEADAVLGAYDFSGLACVVDVGGGRGALLAKILAAYPNLRGALFDRPAVVAAASPELIRERCEITGGDFFAEVPAGGDCYLLKSVLHNWNDERCAAILSACRAAIRADGRLLVLERVVPPGNQPAEAKLFDINMLVMLGGRERTEAEYAARFADAGFQLSRVIPTASPLSIIEARPLA